jgi:predicted membrane channel-forming protein YqfA (hemolysin III family)
MFAGLPGIGVGTLFYILMAFWMPFRELPRVIQGTSTFENWKTIARQMFYSVGIIISVMFAERTMLSATTGSTPSALPRGCTLNCATRACSARRSWRR